MGRHEFRDRSRDEDDVKPSWDTDDPDDESWSPDRDLDTYRSGGKMAYVMMLAVGLTAVAVIAVQLLV